MAEEELEVSYRVSPRHKEMLEGMAKKLGLDLTQVVNAGLVLLKWAIAKREQGLDIVAMDGKNEQVIDMDSLKNVGSDAVYWYSAVPAQSGFYRAIQKGTEAIPLAYQVVYLRCDDPDMGRPYVLEAGDPAKYSPDRYSYWSGEVVFAEVLEDASVVRRAAENDQAVKV